MQPRPHNFIQPHNNFIQPHIPFMPPPGPGIGLYNYQPAMAPLVRPMLEAMLEEEHGGSPVFHSLKSLVLDECETGHDFQTLWRFLRKALFLEKLTLQNCQVHRLE
jgi:hypothetical protein